MQAQSVPSNQHFFPRFGLRPFEHGQPGALKVCWFDKQTFAEGADASGDIACDSGFYDSAIHGIGIQGADGRFKTIENRVAPVLRKLIGNRSLACLDAKNRETIAEYFAIHMSRTPAVRNTVAAVARLIEKIRGYSIQTKFEATDQDLFAAQVKMSPHADPGYLLGMDWALLTCSKEHPFCVGDSWVAVTNLPRWLESRSGVANAGLAIDGTEVRIPLSPTLTLMLVSSQANLYKQRGLLRFDSEPNHVGKNWVDAMRIAQLSAAERYVYAARNDFAWAIEFLESHPHCKQAPENLTLQWMLEAS